MQLDLSKFITVLKRRQAERLAQFDELNDELDEIEEQLRMADTLRSNYCKLFGLPLPVQNNSASDLELRKKLAGLTIEEMLIRIASDNAGILNLATARTSLVKADVFKDERNATTTISPILSRSEHFQRIGRGVYFLRYMKMQKRLPESTEELSIQQRKLFVI